MCNNLCVTYRWRQHCVVCGREERRVHVWGMGHYRVSRRAGHQGRQSGHTCKYIVQ
ncbi:hypothetical protein DPMN_179376 [Dreissena polymorpha]|uniref:Uncharacterized protein n=1 Tax=Dreissena polymorpha TaxID=45954 RepID=A0A9D4ECN8_DREPO|nr:hypothetical protein DPMN_179376 [Dreissena polymorpha]